MDDNKHLIVYQYLLGFGEGSLNIDKFQLLFFIKAIFTKITLSLLRSVIVIGLIAAVR